MADDTKRNDQPRKGFYSYITSMFVALFFCPYAVNGEPARLKEEAKASPQPDMVFLCRENGQEIYTNTKINKGCKSFSLSTSQVQQKPIAPPSPNLISTGSQANFPKVTVEKQKERDIDRRKILEEELSVENKKLAEAKKELSKQEQTVLAEEKNYKTITERLQPHKELVAQHERNIQALQKELSNMK